jgi:hypothetical protein
MDQLYELKRYLQFETHCRLVRCTNPLIIIEKKMISNWFLHEQSYMLAKSSISSIISYESILFVNNFSKCCDNSDNIIILMRQQMSHSWLILSISAEIKCIRFKLHLQNIRLGRGARRRVIILA